MVAYGPIETEAASGTGSCPMPQCQCPARHGCLNIVTVNGFQVLDKKSTSPTRLGRCVLGGKLWAAHAAEALLYRQYVPLGPNVAL